MNLKNEIWELLGTNRELQLKLCLVMKVSEAGLLANISRKSDVLTKYVSLKTIAEYNGVLIHELITEEIPA